MATAFPFKDMDIEKDGSSVEVPYDDESADEIRLPRRIQLLAELSQS